MKFNLLSIESDVLQNLLDFDLIIKEIVAYSYFDQTADILKHVEKKGHEEISYNYHLTDEVFKLIRHDAMRTIQSEFDPLPKEKSFDEIFPRLKKSSILSFKEFNAIFRHLEIKSHLQKTLPPSLQELFPLWEESIQMALNKELRSFRSLVDPSGEIDYDRHPLLRELFKKQKEIEKKIRVEIHKLITSEELSSKLRYNQYDLINDRYVLPIRSDSYNTSLGLIMGHSESGMTLYVEPLTVRELSNSRIEVIAQIDEVIYSLCKDLTEKIAPFAFSLYDLRKAFYRLDELFSKSLYSYNNNFERPTLSQDQTTSLINFYHPLLKNPVKNSLKLYHDQRGLIISGPNTGGKTVTLKALGLCHLFVHYSLFLPVSKATINVYDQIYYFGNDQQNLEAGLSSFAAEVENYLELLETVSDQALILVDEIFNSTSSEEASALALSFFDEIFKLKDIKIIVSTHHQMLKSFTHEDKRFLCAHMGFDLSRNSPTYHLLVGTPGSSMALKIFENLAKKRMETRVLIKKAQEILDNRYQSYENLLQKLSRKQIHLDKLIKGNELIKHDLSNKKKSIEGALKLEMQSKIAEYEKKLSKIIKNVQSLIDEFKEQKITIKTLSQKSRELELDFRSEKEKIIQPKSTVQDERRSVPQEFKEGNIYYCDLLNSKVTLKKIDDNKKMAIVQKGAVTIKVSLSSLFLDSTILQLQKTKNKESIIVNTPSSNEEDSFPLQYDLRGLRLEEFSSRVEIILGNLLLHRMPYALIIHGHGDGVLKSWLRTHLEKSGEFSWKRSSENDGSTEVTVI